MDRETVRVDYEALKKLYDKAIENKENIIEYQGHKWVTLYVKYVLEYLEHRLGI